MRLLFVYILLVSSLQANPAFGPEPGLLESSRYGASPERMDAGRGITLPSNSALSEELDFTSYEDPEDMKDDVEDLKEDSLSIRQTNTVRYDVNKAVGSAHLEVVKQFDSGWSLGFITGFEKHISVHGLPEYTRSYQFSGSRGVSHSLPQGVVSGTANYTAGHDTVVNEGATGYTDVNKIPAKVVLGVPASSSDNFLISGQTTFSDGNESRRMQLEKAGGGLGWQRRMENGSFQVEANAFQDYSTVETTGRPQMGFGLSIGGMF